MKDEKTTGATPFQFDLPDIDFDLDFDLPDIDFDLPDIDLTGLGGLMDEWHGREAVRKP